MPGAYDFSFDVAELKMHAWQLFFCIEGCELKKRYAVEV
jgi:hypothetical protein